MAKVPFGNAACATRRVASGIGCSSSGRNDIRLLLPALIGAREQPNRSADQGPAEFATSVNVRVTRGQLAARCARRGARRGSATLTAHYGAGEGPATAAVAEERRRPGPPELPGTV